MGKPTGFIDYKRHDIDHRPIAERVKDYREVDIPLPTEELLRQAARCMDCGIPFCHGTGCPLNNRIPEFNDLVYQNRWQEAIEVLHSTNNFPEITGRICPAPCEAACTLNINDDSVLIKHIECQIIERAFAEGWIAPHPAVVKTGKRVAIIGSGPSGLAAAQQLARMGHEVILYEKDERIGGLLRYGIPDFKLDKKVIDRRLDQMAAEGVVFEPGVNVGVDVSANYLLKRFDAVLLTMGAGKGRDLQATGRELGGIYMAMDYLGQQNRAVGGETVAEGKKLPSAKDKIVVVIGGGDTGSDCVGTARRQGAKEIYQLEILPKPPDAKRNPETPWPNWPRIMRTSTSHEEGCQRKWSVMTKEFVGAGNIREIRCCEVQWVSGPKGWAPQEVAGSEFTLKADMVLLAMGFVHVVHEGLVTQMGLKLDARGNVQTNDYMTSREGVFAAGDTVEGASLVVRAINSGRQAADAVNRWLAKS